MPVPRLFEASPDPREHWVHVIASLLGLGGPETRTALVEEISGETLPGADAILVREQRQLGEGLFADVVARGAGWTLALVASLAFDDDLAGTITAVHDSLADGAKDRLIVVGVTPDRRPPAAIEAASGDGRTIRHRSWLRVRDWVQERPERGNAQGIDLLLLREAEYFLTPRVAELYRLEGLMPLVPVALRPSLASAFFALNDLSPAPLIQNEEGAAKVLFPRTGEPQVELALGDGLLTASVVAERSGPGTVAEGDWQRLKIASEEDYLAGRAWLRGAARAVLPARR